MCVFACHYDFWLAFNYKCKPGCVAGLQKKTLFVKFDFKKNSWCIQFTNFVFSFPSNRPSSNQLNFEAINTSLFVVKCPFLCWGSPSGKLFRFLSFLNLLVCAFGFNLFSSFASVEYLILLCNIVFDSYLVIVCVFDGILFKTANLK